MNKIIIIVTIVVIIAIGGFFLLQNNADNGTTSVGGAPVLDLGFTDYEGNTVTLADFKGTPLVVNAWAVWCPFCLKELSDFAKAQKEFGNKINIIAVNRQESRSLAKNYTDDLGITDDLVFLLDKSDKFYRAIGGFSMPETIFVDAEGNIVEHKRGVMSLEEIRQKINNLLVKS